MIMAGEPFDRAGAHLADARDIPPRPKGNGSPPPGRFGDDEPGEPGNVPEAGNAEASPGEAKPKPKSVLAERWVSLSAQPELLLDTPPAQEWLFTQWREGRDFGVFPRGRTGLVTGTGGVSKTMALIQLALAQATGGFWLETFKLAAPGRVLLALAEEDLLEARRRLWRACNALELSRDERAAAAERIDLLPLAGAPVALTRADPKGGEVLETKVAGELRKLLDERAAGGWSLVIIDPLSRWAGGGTEIDNEAATRFCQTIETLAAVAGTPSVLVAHHSSKASAREGGSDARGVTGIRDGFRWMASMDAVQSKDGARAVLLRNRKSNYSLEFDDLVLLRSSEPGSEGTLRLATEAERKQFETTAPGAREAVGDDVFRARVLETIGRHAGLKSASAVSRLTTGSKGRVLAAVDWLLAEKKIEKTAAGFAVRDTDETA